MEYFLIRMQVNTAALEFTCKCCSNGGDATTWLAVSCGWDGDDGGA